MLFYCSATLSHCHLLFCQSLSISLNSNTTSAATCRSYVTTSTVVPAKSAVFVPITFSPALSDDTNVLLTPLRSVLSKHSVIVPYVLAIVRNNFCFLPIANLLSGPQTLPRHMQIVQTEILPPSCHICSVNTTVPSRQAPVLSIDSNTYNISSHLSNVERACLVSLLTDFST